MHKRWVNRPFPPGNPAVGWTSLAARSMAQDGGYRAFKPGFQPGQWQTYGRLQNQFYHERQDSHNQNSTGWTRGALNANNPSARLRASRPMPAWMHVTRTGPPPPPPPPPRDESVDPDYEVIDFGNNGQIYSNAPLPVGNNKSGKRCDLCGSSAPAVRCVQCTQNFCLSCDHMYHRHPKRQAHTRKELQDNKVRPPLPPKGESAPAPVPPPRRNKTSGRPPPARPAAPPLQRNQEVKSPALLNSLARALPSRPLADPPFPTMQNGVSSSPLQPERPSPLGMHKHHGNVGMSEWDVNRTSRAGSFSNLGAPGFSPLIQAQSMAQLNSPCPSCHFHGPTPPPMSPWGNNDPWGTWGAMPPWQSQTFLNYPPARRGSRRGSMRHRRETSSGSEEEDDRMSRRGGGRRGNVSPTPSRRSRAPPSDYDSDEDRDDVGWEPRRGLSRRASLIDVNRSHRRDDDTMSLSGKRFTHATLSRAQRERRYEEEPIKNRRNTIDKISYADDDRINSRSSGQKASDADDSPRGYESSSLRRKSSRRSEARSERFSNPGRRKNSPVRSLYNDNPSDSLDDDSNQINHKLPTAEAETTVEAPQNGVEPADEPETEWDPVPDFEWECAHCTFVNSPGTRVCCICCKTNTKPKRHDEAPVSKVAEQMKSSTLERTGSRRNQERPRQQDSTQERLYQKQDSYPDQQRQQNSNQDRQRQQDAYQDRQRQQDAYQDRQRQQGPQPRDSFDRVQDKSYQKQDSNQDRSRQQDSFDRIQDRSYQKQDSQSERQQRQDNPQDNRSFQKQEYPDRQQRQQDFNGRTRDQVRYQERVRTPEKSARGTSPMTAKRVEPNRSLDARSPDVRTPDTKTSDSSSYSSRNVMSTSKGTSPPPQSISTQTYEVPQTKLKRATSFADYSEWRAPQRTYSRQSLLSDTQSLPVTPPKGRSPERFPDAAVVDSRRESEPLQARRRAGSQPPEYISTLVQKQVKQGLEMVKLLREAEEQKFSADDLAVALLHCEDGDPVAWLQQNWRNMIDTVVTLATNYGHERKENTVGTISASEAREALRIHDGNVWAAVTECVEQRQKKYAELLSRGNFSREDIITVLTANHGNLEAAYTELSKSQLKPFLMKIWGPPQGVDNESGNITKLAHDEAKGMGRGGIEQEEVSFNDFNMDRVQTWIDNSVPKSKLSQSMMHLNLIGNNNKALEKLEALSNLTKDEKRDLRARRTSDVHRYLTQFYALNENSLKISKSFTNIHDVNKAQKENNNPLWKFLEKNLGLNSFASSGLLTTVSTTSSNLHVKSMTDFDSDSLNEGRSGGSEKSETDGKTDVGQIPETLDELTHLQAEGVQIKIEEPDDTEDVTETGELPKANGNITEQLIEQQQQNYEMEIHATSPIRQIFVKSISVSTEGSRPVSPTKSKSPENEVDDEESDASSGSWESVDEDSEDEEKEIDMNLAKNNESKDVAVLGKLILKEEGTQGPFKELQQLPVPIIENTVETATADVETFREEDLGNESEEEIMQMVETLLQKTEFLQEDSPAPAETQKSINVMYTNKDFDFPGEKPQSDERNTDDQGNGNVVDNLDVPQTEDIQKENEELDEFDEAITDQPLPGSKEPKPADVDNNQDNIDVPQTEDIQKENEELDEFDEAVTDQPLPSSKEPKPADVDNNQDMDTEENVGVGSASVHAEITQKTQDPQGGSASKNEHLEKERPLDVQNENQIMVEAVELGEPENPPEEGTWDVQEPSQQGYQENPGMVQDQPSPSSPTVEGLDIKDEGIAAGGNQSALEEAPDDDNTDEIFEEPPDILENQTSLVDTLVEIGQTLSNIVAAPLSESHPALGDVTQPAVVAILPTSEDDSVEKNKEQVMPAKQPATVHAEENSSKVAEATQGSSSGTPQTALNMMETDSKSLATNLLQNSEGNSERDISPIPTDSDKDPEVKLIKERQRLSRTKSSYELSMGDKLFEDNNRLQRTTSSHELVTLLKESLAKDDVVERIVSTLFQSVLRANDLGRPGRSSSMHISRHGSSLSRDMSYMGSSPSEIDDSEFFYEAVEPREVIPERRSRRNFRKRGRNSRRRGTPRRFDDSSVMSTSTDNYSNRDEHSSSASQAEIPEDLTETEREARRLLAEGIVSTYEKAEMIVQLRMLNFEEEDCILAAKECSTTDAAVTFLQQECDLCAGKYSMKQMVSMLECEHTCCKECAQNYFTLQITERSVNDCVCPFCKEPDISKLDEDTASDYFGHLDIFLKAIVSENTHELFQRKLRDRTLMSDPHFKWCIKCSSGFIANPKQRKLICPDCRTITCANCRRPWEREHEKMTCEEFAAFKNESEQDNQVEKHLAEGGVTCPKCHQRYLLAKGGCMHLTCPHCKHDFCSGCSKPFLMGSKCKVSANCERLGLHSHHPRNCLFYLRDKDPPVLEQLLQEHGVELTNKEDDPSASKCKTQLLKETTEGLIEAICGHPVEGAGLCRRHYVEHLSLLIRGSGLETIPILETGDLETVVRRTGKKLPPNPYGSPESDYRQALIEVAAACSPHTGVLDETHYIEHLVDLLTTNKIDPVGVMDATDAVQELRRHGKELPTRADYANDKEFLKVCMKIISEEIPLE